jgi:dolichol-phosphate mannosyltransferase
VSSLVILPTYNERSTAGAVLGRLFESVDTSTDALVVDDGSSDHTADVVDALMAANDRIHLMQRHLKRGLASAYLDGFKWALQRGYDAIVEMDADLSHDPAMVPVLLDGLVDADLVLGSRYVPGGRVENWGMLRRLLSRAGNTYARLWLPFSVRDSTTGFRAYRASAIAAQDLSGISSDGYAFQIEMTLRIFTSGGRIKEVPITFSERRWGRSKLSRRIVVEALVSVPVWGVKHRLFRPGRLK